jgi:arylsulfatase A-like enzyme
MQSKCCSILTQDGEPIKDLWDTDQPARNLNGTDYEELIFQKRMFEIMDQHAEENTDQPLFLFYAPHVAHCPLQVPESYLEQLDWMDNDEDMCQAQTKNIVGPQDNTTKYSCRKQYAAMVQLLDDILGNLVDRLKHHGMWDNTLMVVTSDNGGPVDPDESGATNFPLRGGKYSDFEGGVRAVAFVSGGFIPQDRRGTIVNDPIHICDWYATLPALAGINVHLEEAQWRNDNYQNVPPIDAVDVWPLIVGEGTTNRLQSSEKEIPLSMDGLIIGDYKLLWHEGENITLAGYTYPDYPNSQTGKTEIRQQSINCSAGCLFNVNVDPSERIDMATSQPERVEAMKQRLLELRKGFFENDDRGLDSCPKGFNNSNKDLLCACWMAVNYYGGFFGPYQEVDIASRFMEGHDEFSFLVDDMS